MIGLSNWRQSNVRRARRCSKSIRRTCRASRASAGTRSTTATFAKHCRSDGVRTLALRSSCGSPASTCSPKPRKPPEPRFSNAGQETRLAGERGGMPARVQLLGGKRHVLPLAGAFVNAIIGGSFNFCAKAVQPRPGAGPCRRIARLDAGSRLAVHDRLLGPRGRLPKAADGLPGHSCDHGASLRVPSRWTTTVQARVR